MATFIEDPICLSEALDKLGEEEGIQQRNRASISYVQGHEFNPHPTSQQPITTTENYGERIHEIM